MDKIDKKDLKELQTQLRTIMNFGVMFEEKSFNKSIMKHLTLKEIHILEIIDMYPNETLTFYANKWKTTLGSFMTAIKNLVKKEYLEQVQDEIDKRITRVSCTKKAAYVLREHRELHNDLMAQLLEKCKVKEVQNTFKALSEIIEEKINSEE